MLINIGRSNIISESALIKALDKKWLSAAILDVFDEEPLPSDSPLWERDDVCVPLFFKYYSIKIMFFR